jgi:ribonuclease HIII
MERTKLSISPLFREQVKQAVMQLCAFEEKAEQNCAYRLDFTSPQGWVRVKQFTNGTLYLEATDSETLHQILAVIAQITGEKVVVPQKAAPSPAGTAKSSPTANGGVRGLIDINEPYIGTDESGKGDYFGPLVVAGVFTTPQMAAQLLALGVMDSKLLKDAQMKAIAAQIQTLVGPQGFNVVEISPKRYNELYDSFKQGGKNLNHLLAWGHARVLENLLERNPDCHYAIADQFGSEHYIRSQLQTRGRKIELHQTPKAEANIGVAAASILARVRFVNKIQTLSAKYGVQLPLGAGTQVVEAARRVVDKHGRETLKEIAKLHFKTTETLWVLR